jgi:hypothetical protein
VMTMMSLHNYIWENKMNMENLLQQIEALTEENKRLMEIIAIGTQDNPDFGDYSKSASNFLAAWLSESEKNRQLRDLLQYKDVGGICADYRHRAEKAEASLLIAKEALERIANDKNKVFTTKAAIMARKALTEMEG